MRKKLLSMTQRRHLRSLTVLKRLRSHQRKLRMPKKTEKKQKLTQMVNKSTQKLKKRQKQNAKPRNWKNLATPEKATSGRVTSTAKVTTYGVKKVSIMNGITKKIKKLT